MTAWSPEGRGGEPRRIVTDDAADAARAAAVWIAERLATAIDAGGVAHWATTGGSSPAAIYDALVVAPLRDAVDWSRVHLWFGDERFVRRGDPLANARIADEHLLTAGAGVPMPASHVHAIPTDAALDDGLGPDWAAARYAEAIARWVPDGDGGWPGFDIVIVGIGPDGHLLSVFPGSEAFESPATVLAIPAPTHVEPHVERVTLHPATLDAAGALLAVTTGSGKAGIVGTIFGAERDARRWPAQLARRAGATWILDRAAAADLPPDLPAE